MWRRAAERKAKKPGRIFPGRPCSPGRGWTWTGDIPVGGPALSTPPWCGAGTNPHLTRSPQTSLVPAQAELLTSSTCLATKGGLSASLLPVLGRRRQFSGHEERWCFISIPLRPTAAALLPIFPFALGKCLPPYRPHALIQTSPLPAGTSGKALNGKYEKLFGRSAQGAEFKEGGVAPSEGDRRRLCRRADQSWRPRGHQNSECSVILLFSKPRTFFFSYTHSRLSTFTSWKEGAYAMNRSNSLAFLLPFWLAPGLLRSNTWKAKDL